MDKIDKEQIRQAILQILKEQFQVLEKAVRTAVDATTHADARQEGKYDTRAIESGYIAGAQADRLAKLQQLIQYVSRVPMRTFGEADAIAETALVETIDQDEVTRVYLLLRGVSAIEIEVSGTTIISLTPDSLIGQALMSQYVGDECSIDHADRQTIREIVKIA